MENNRTITILSINNLNLKLSGDIFNLAGIICSSEDKNKIYFLDYNYMGPYINDSFIERCYNDHNITSISDYEYLNSDLKEMYNSISFSYFDQNGILIQEKELNWYLLSTLTNFKITQLKQNNRIIDFLHLFWLTYANNKRKIDNYWFYKYSKYIKDFTTVQKEVVDIVFNSLRKLIK